MNTTTKIISFRRAFDLVLSGAKVRARLWSAEYYLLFEQGELYLMPTRQIIPIRQLATWRQLYKEWEIYGS
jgi:hypothetical protein